MADVVRTVNLLNAEGCQVPRDARLRTFLFQLFRITGEWDRALTQLNVVGELNHGTYPMVQTYQAVIRCEVLRAKIFAGQRSPTILGNPGPWLPLLIEATRLLATGEPERAAALRDAAFERAPPLPASIDGTSAEWIADADPRLGPVMEAIIEGRYVWVPYDRIRSVALDPPQDLRDQVWMPATFTWTNDGTAVGFIPTRYPGTTDSADPALLLARRTEFQETKHWSIPVGQRMIVTDAVETALMDLRRFDLAPVPARA